uniref:RING finger protein, putative n=1 Tax=Entamoeba histolytica TaxID=5759 RepID=S0AW56_ENTHI|nr:RING finger protein, putative [Entamoeba histolytica]
MGICHICKEQTTLYCVDHEKHICLNCLLKSHKECTICQYVGYVDGKVKKDNTCHLCGEEIFEGDLIVRLPCLHKFHQECLLKSLSNIHLNESESCENQFKCPECLIDIFTEENKNTVLMQSLIQQFKQLEFIKKYANISDENVSESTTSEVMAAISLKNNDEDSIVVSQSVDTTNKGDDVAIGINPEEQSIELEIDEDEDKKIVTKDMDGNSLLQTKIILTWRTKILIVILVICFIFLIKALINQHSMVITNKQEQNLK